MGLPGPDLSVIACETLQLPELLASMLQLELEDLSLQPLVSVIISTELTERCFAYKS